MLRRIRPVFYRASVGLAATGAVAAALTLPTGSALTTVAAASPTPDQIVSVEQFHQAAAAARRAAPQPAAPAPAAPAPPAPAPPAPGPQPAAPAPAPVPVPPPAAPVPATPAAAHVTAAVTAAAAPAQSGWGCAPAIAYLSSHSAPGFQFECPGYALGHQAMTCINVAGVCPGTKLIVINVACPAAYMNEAHNSWVLSGLQSGSIDPYGYCRV